MPCHALMHSSAWAVRPLAAGEPLPHTLASCCIGSGCPSFGGQRTARSTRKALRSRVFGGGLFVKQSWNTKRTRSCRSLTLRFVAAPRCRVNTRHRLPRAIAGVLRHANAVNASLVHAGPVHLGGRPNTSVKRTHNGGAGLLAASTSAAPSCAAYLKR